jgi:thiamine-phosphate pyrophosphorylase
MKLDRFYPIFDSAAWIARMLPLGVRLVQLRVQDRPEPELRAEIRRARDLCAEAGAQLIVNDHWKLAIDEGCDFVHLGQEDLDAADLPAIRRAGLHLGVSTHDDAELDRALAVRPDYVALGPVYPTILKAMKWREQGLDRVRDWKRRIGALPLVAIGGLSVERAAGVFAAGADIASVVTDITLNPDPEARVRAWIGATR